MSKAVLYGLVIGLTYATLDKGVFREGVGYTAEQLGDHIDDTNDEGLNYFEEVGEDEIVGENLQSNEVKTTKKSVTINKKTAAASEGDGKVGDVDPGKVTV